MKRNVVLLGALVVCAAASAPAHGAQTLRVQVDQNGDFLLIGNSLGQDCSSGTPAPIVGTVGACGSNTGDSAPDVSWRSDDVAGTAAANTGITVANSRSSAMLAIPAGATVTHAFLFWSGESTGQASASDPTVTIDRPDLLGGTIFSQSVTAQASDCRVTATNPRVYQCTADITSVVQTNGSGKYRVSGVNYVSFNNRSQDVTFANWSLVVFFDDPTEPPRNLALFDGLDVVDGSNSATATLDGFLVPDAGFDAKLGVIAYEGDGQFSGDQLRFGIAPLDATDALSDGTNPVTNFFNSSRSRLGSAVTVAGDLPQLSGASRSMGSFDIDVVNITSRVVAGQTAADIEATTGGDVYFLGAFITSISTFRPDFSTSTKAVEDVNGGALKAGDTLRYTLTATNTGNDTAINVVLTDPLPPEVTFVPGSIEIVSGPNAGPKTDAVNDDQAEFAAGEVVVRLGAGADAVTGGDLLPGESSVVEFLVTINAGVSGVVSNQAFIDFEGEQGSPPETTPTDGDGGNPGQDPTDVVVEECETDSDCTDPSEPRCDTAEDPNVCVECLDDNDCSVPTPKCELSSNACVECLEDTDCVFGNYTCDGTFICVCTPLGAEQCGNDADEDCDGVLDNGCLDSDDDGIFDDVEDDAGTDPFDADSDDDGVIDGDEPDWDEDSDGDGLINALDPDSDDDGLFDGTELGLGCGLAATNSAAGACVPDGDAGATTTNPLDADSDDGGVRDGAEDADLDGVIDAGETDPTSGHGADDTTVADSDGDGLSDEMEQTLGTDPNDADSDDDGLLDGAESNPSHDTDGDGLINPLDPDSDDDALFDGTEAGQDCNNPATDPAAGSCTPDADAGATTTYALVPDSDGGGAVDGAEDCNLDGAVDSGETDPNDEDDDPTVTDSDNDGLSNCTENTIGSDPNDQDSDDDGLPDGEEPNPADDHDGDGVINILDPDSDDDDLFDGTELGKNCNNPDTNVAAGNCIADGDAGATTTNPLDPDTDDGTVPDGTEDSDHDGVIDAGETDPNDGSDDLSSSGAGGSGGGGAGAGGAATGGAAAGGNGSGGNGSGGNPNGPGAGGGGPGAGGGGPGPSGAGGSGANAADGYFLQGGACGCATPGSRGGSRALAALALLAVMALTRRRRPTT
jgi:uncharacterized repeat protein (TIGR01451 family)